MVKPSRRNRYRCAFIGVLCSVHSLSWAESLPEPSASWSPAPVLRSWMEAIAEATQRGGRWLVEGRILQLGVSTQSTQPLPPVFCLQGLGTTESATAVMSLPLTNGIAIAASAGFHHPLSASTGAAQGFSTLEKGGRMFGAGVLLSIGKNTDASLRLERLTAYPNSPQGTLDATVVALGIGFRF